MQIVPQSPHDGHRRLPPSDTQMVMCGCHRAYSHRFGIRSCRRERIIRPMRKRTATRPLSLHHLTMLNATPFELVDAAAAGGFDMCGVRIVPADPDQSVFDLISDSSTRRTFIRRLEDSGVRLLDVEAVWIRGDTNVQSLVPALHTAAELGARHVLTVGNDFETASADRQLGTPRRQRRRIRLDAAGRVHHLLGNHQPRGRRGRNPLGRSRQSADRHRLPAVLPRWCGVECPCRYTNLSPALRTDQ